MPEYISKRTIAIDGPANSGKSTVAILLAKKLKFLALDSGALYRAMTYYALQSLGPDFHLKLEIVDRYFRDHPHSMQIEWEKGQFCVYLMGKPLREEIRSEAVSQHISYIAEYGHCRAFINKLMLRAAARHDLVVEGRDIGTEVFPNAWAKFFLQANSIVRARRRAEQLGIAFPSAEFNKLLQAIEMRDDKDSKRSLAPLKKATDALSIDSSRLTPEQVVAEMIHLLPKEAPALA